MTARLFAVGDRVKMRTAACPVFNGRVGTVVGYDSMVSPAPVLVTFDFWTKAPCHVAESELTRISEGAQ